MAHEEFFSSEERKIRERWLFWSIELPIGILSVPWAFMLFCALNLDSKAVLLVIGAGTVVGVVAYIPYYCAYKNPGYIFLTLSLIWMPLKFLINLYELSIKISQESQHSYVIFLHLFSLVINIGYSMWIFYLSFRLRKINKKVTSQILLNTEEYQQAASIFEQAINLEDLNAKFKNLMSSTESGRDRDLIASAYKARRAQLVT